MVTQRGFGGGARISVLFTTDGISAGEAVTVRSKRAPYDAKVGGGGL